MRGYVRHLGADASERAALHATVLSILGGAEGPEADARAVLEGLDVASGLRALPRDLRPTAREALRALRAFLAAEGRRP